MSESIEQYRVHAFELKATQQVDDPFSIRVGLTATHEDGIRLDIPGFYDGDDTWRIRFSPSLTGKWTCSVTSDVDELNQPLADLVCVPNTDPDAHGRVGVSNDHAHRFAHADGTSFVPLGFEWNWLSAYHQEHADPRDDRPNPTFAGALDRIQAGGFNYIVANLYADYYNKTPDTDETRPYLYQHPRLYPFGGTNEHPDHSVLNPSFFQDLDKAVEALKRRHITLHLMIQVQNKKVNWPEPGSSEDDRPDWMTRVTSLRIR